MQLTSSLVVYIVCYALLGSTLTLCFSFKNTICLRMSESSKSTKRLFLSSSKDRLHNQSYLSRSKHLLFDQPIESFQETILMGDKSNPLTNVTDGGSKPSDISDKIHPLQAFENDVTFVLNNLTIGKDDTIYPSIFGTNSLTISRIWDLDLWRKSGSRTRHLRNLKNIFKSSLFKRVFPQLLVCIVWSIISMFFITSQIKSVASIHHIPLASLSLVSTFIALLITIRSNQSLGRLAEARELWGRLFIVTRDTAQMLVTYVYPKDKKLGLKAARHLSLMAWLLKDRLRDTNREDIIEAMLSGESEVDVIYLTSQRKKPAAAIARIRQVVADLAARNVLPYAPHQQLEQNLNEMNYILGMCERLKGSPIPPVYTTHTSRLLAFYLIFLPLALHGSQMTKLVSILVTTTVSYAMLGLDEISHVLEQPFGLMPLHQLSRNIMSDIADAFVCQPPSFITSAVKIKDENSYYRFNDSEMPQPSYW